MINLDKFLSTEDELFNTNMQSWYFEFSGNNKPETNKDFHIFAQALHEIYFFIQSNLNKPFACIEKINKVSEQHNLNNGEKLLLLDQILGILVYNPEFHRQAIVFIQLVHLRNGLKSYFDDPEILNPNWQFDFERIKENFATIKDVNERHRYLTNLLFDFYIKVKEIDEMELAYYEDIGFVKWIEMELKRAEYERQNRIIAIISQFKLSKRTGAKTDFIRVLNALYDLHFFVNKKETEPIKKKDFMQQIGQFFDMDLSNYDAALSQARREQPLETNLKIFDEMKKLTQDQHYTSQEKRNKNK